MNQFLISRYSIALATICLFSIVLLCSCGGNSSTANPNSVTGNWTVTLFNSSNVAAYTFTTTLNQENGSPTTTSSVTGSNLQLTTPTTDASKVCFDAPATAQQTGLYTVTDNFNGLAATTLQLTIAGNPGTIAMKGTFITNTISGPWSLTTTGPNTCDVSGTFLMRRVS